MRFKVSLKKMERILMMLL